MANSATAPAAAPATPDPEDTKKARSRDKFMEFFSLSNPDLWITIAVIVLILVLVRFCSRCLAPHRPRSSWAFSALGVRPLLEHSDQVHSGPGGPAALRLPPIMLPF